MPAPKQYVLVADDDQDDQQFLKEIFMSHLEEVELVTLPDGSEIIDFLENCLDEKLPLLILLDFKMPRLTAAQTLQSLAGNRRYATIPKMVWSTSNRPEYVHDCMQWGATHYFLKPSSMDEFSHIVVRIVETVKFHLSTLP
jgi:CheY-like chemotaxis protein